MAHIFPNKLIIFINLPRECRY